jgi:hypothetical protein
MTSLTTARLLVVPAIVALACALAGCKQKAPQAAKPAPARTAASVPTPPTREQAMASLMALPEVKTWSTQIEKDSRGKAHGAVIEDDTAPRLINGKPYWQFSFVENRAESAHRRQSFLVAQSGEEILIEDMQSAALVSLPEWRRTVRRVELKAAQ